jgi:ABC-type transporter Mla subunit MlaD
MDQVHARRLAAHNSRKQELDEKEKAVAAKEAEMSRLQAAIEERERALHRLVNEAAVVRKTLLVRQRELDNAISAAKAHKERYRDAIREVCPRAETTLANVRQAIGALSKIRDRNSPAKNTIEARSLGFAKETIEALEMVALTFDDFVSARSASPNSEPDPILANGDHLLRPDISTLQVK